jgi:hypothetical protein
MFAASKTASVSGGYQISRSLRFNSADGTSLDRTPSSATNRQTFTISFWAKNPSTSGAITTFYAAGNNTNVDETLIGYWDGLYVQNALSSASWRIRTNAVYRDPSAWYHYIFAFDLSNGTQANRLKIYVNGVESAYSAADGNPLPSTANSQINNNVIQYIGRRAYSSTGQTTNAYMTEFYLIDGQALTPSSFGETNAQTGVWQPKVYSGLYGTNGFYLNFSDNSNTTAATLGKDYSGNGNNWTPNNFSVTAGSGNDSLVDSPTSYGVDTGVGGTVRGNYCTWNPIGSVLGAGSATNGNLDVACADSTTGAAGSRGTMATTSGQWYFEVLVVSGGTYSMIGVSDANKVITSAGWGSVNAWCYYGNTGSKYGNGTDASYGATYTTGDLIGVAYDSDAGTLTFYKNGTSQGQAFTGLTGKALSPYVGTASGTMTFTLNAGQRPFAYTAPSGFKALCTQNLPTPTIGATTATQAGKYFNPVLYTGTAATQTITGVGFQPDMVWIKRRDGADNNVVDDAVRGAGQALITNATVAEQNYTSAFTAFASDGFTVTSSFSALNASAATYVSWNWKANGSGSTNTSGTITSTVSANTTSGFSVVTYTGTGSAATIGHGLGIAPSMLIFKSRSNGSENWNVYHKSLGASTNILLNSTIAAFTDAAFLNATAPTSTVLSVGGAGSTGTNQSSGTYVCYAFSEVAGYSKFGSYTGNGSTAGPFVYTGFKPRFVMIKIASGSTYNTDNWFMFDTARGPYNDNNPYLLANTSGAEGAFTSPEMLSNGFCVNTISNALNYNGSTYIYMAFAESPFKYSLAR